MAQGNLTNPGGGGENDLSDVRLTTPDYAEVSPTQLPIRGEKRIIPSFVDINATQDKIGSGVAAGGQDPDTAPAINFSDFMVSAALKPFVDYILVRIPHRGFTNGQADPTKSATFRFLINPATVQVNHATLDAQSMTRGGWQFGVWGEDCVTISLSGQTAGQYFALGLTDAFQSFTKSWRNLEQLQMVYENNGYWYEGEEAGEGPLKAADFTRRRIKMHQDVELVCGNFIWFGMFDSMTISQDAEKPFLANFSITFLAWKERFRNSAPYIDNIHNEIQRGHVFGQYPTPPPGTPNAPPPFAPLPSSPFTPPAVNADAYSQTFVTNDTAAQDQTPTFDLMNPNNPLSIFSRG
jgi:hypothetical protein